MMIVYNENYADTWMVFGMI